MCQIFQRCASYGLPAGELVSISMDGKCDGIIVQIGDIPDDRLIPLHSLLNGIDRRGTLQATDGIFVAYRSLYVVAFVRCLEAYSGSGA